MIEKTFVAPLEIAAIPLRHPKKALHNRVIRRELKEELNFHVGALTPIGRFDYKRAAHMVYAAETDIHEFDWDDTELVELRWFSLAEVEQLAEDQLLHAGYELDAVRAVIR